MNDLEFEYNKMKDLLCDIEDEEVIKKADLLLAEIETELPELVEKSIDYIKCFSGNPLAKIKVVVLGADGHSIVGALRRSFVNTEVIWFPNVNTKRICIDGKADGMIVSKKAFIDLQDEKESFNRWNSYIINDGFILFRQNNEINTTKALNRLNEAGIVPLRYVSGDVLYSTNIAYRLHDILLKNNFNVKCKYKKIYCICPANIKTGGTEVLHQLVYTINMLGGCAEIAFINHEENRGYVNEELAKYVVGHITTIEDIDDSSDNAVVIPEGWAYVCADIANAEIMFWWLSVDNFRRFCSDVCTEEELLTLVRYKASKHLVQSEYARQYVIHNNIPLSKIYNLSDYINNIYTEEKDWIIADNRDDVVLYNPLKGGGIYK